jgi:AsmA protein
MTSRKRLWIRVVLGVLGLVMLAVAALAIFIATFDVERYKPLAVAWVRQHHDRQLELSGPIRLGLFPRLAVSVQGASLSERGRADVMARAEALELQLALAPLLRRQLEIERLQIRGVNLRYHRAADGRSNLDDFLGPPAQTGAVAATGTDTAPPVRLDIAAVSVRDVTLEVQDERAQVRGRLSLSELTTGRIAASASTPLTFKAAVDLREPALQGDIALDARMQLGADLFNSFTLPDLKLGLSLSAPGLPRQRLELQGEAALTEPQIRWQLAGTWKGVAHDGPITTHGRYQRADASVDASLQLATLDIDAAMRAQASATGAAAPTNAKPGTSGSPGDAPIDLSIVPTPRARIDLRADRVRVHGITLSAVQAQVRGDGRQLRVDPFRAQVWRGQVQGQAAVIPAGSQWSVLANARDIRMEQALQDLVARDGLRGVGALSLDLSTRGRSVHEFKRQLAGQARFQLRDASVKGFNLAALGRQAKAALSLKKDALTAASTSEQTDFSEISASFAIAGGVARSNDLSAKSPYLRVTGEGAVDIGQSTLDYTAFVTVTDTSKGQGGADLAVPGGVRVPVRLSGPFDAVQVQVQWSAVSSAVARQAVQQKIEQKLGATNKQEARDKLKDKLKGLFK